MINSDDIEVVKLAADILRKTKGKSYVSNLIRNNRKYEFRKGKGLVKISTFLVDMMKPYQIQFNILMNKLSKYES